MHDAQLSEEDRPRMLLFYFQKRVSPSWDINWNVKKFYAVGRTPLSLFPERPLRKHKMFSHLLCPLLTWTGKEPACQYKRFRFSPWVGKIPCRRAWQPTPRFLPGESHGQRSLAGYRPWGCKESDTTEHTQTYTARLIVFVSLKKHWAHWADPTGSLRGPLFSGPSSPHRRHLSLCHLWLARLGSRAARRSLWAGLRRILSGEMSPRGKAGFLGRKPPRSPGTCGQPCPLAAELRTAPPPRVHSWRNFFPSL